MKLRTFALIPAVGAVTGLAGVLTLPPFAGTQADELAALAAAPGRFLLGNLLTFVSTGLIGAGLFMIGHRCAVRGDRTAAVFARLAGVGWVLHMALIAHNAVALELAAMPDRAAAVAVAEDVYAGPVFLGLLIPMLVTSVFGTVATAVTLWRIGFAPVWSAAALTLAMLADFVTPEQFSGVPMFALLSIGFLGLLWQPNRKSTSDEHERFRAPSEGSVTTL